LKKTTASSAESYACGEGVRPGYPAVLAEAGTERQSAMCRFVYGLNNAVKGIAHHY
jgi:hypothetical protein